MKIDKDKAGIIIYIALLLVVIGGMVYVVNVLIEHVTEKAVAGHIPEGSVEYICKDRDYMRCFEYFGETDDRWVVFVNRDQVTLIKQDEDRKVFIFEK